ncbi:MAG: carboxylesterase family protein [Blastocatellia bacterium]|nr:carboxylesterase family protein [Blastocatellia bacterium]
MKIFLPGCLILLAAFALGSNRVAAVNGVVKVENGSLEGTATAAGIRVFKGIPYAAPPVGDFRWRPPQPPAKWNGVRKADKFSDSCMQALRRTGFPWTKEFMVQNDASEDCLCLNVWTGAKTANEKRPVLVWIHGGAFYEGSGEIITYDGEELAKKGVVVVTINYRLGIFGFYTHPELTKESPNHSSGNYGLLDCVAALQWVQKNIAAFGGDPSRVTIAGQSAGAAAVHTLTASPLAKGLFHRAIAESGSSIARRTRDLSASEQDGVKWAETKGATSLKELRAKPAADLMGGTRFGPVVDGWYLPADTAAIFAQGKQNDVPMLTGLTADEGSSSATYGKIKAEDFAKQAQQRFGAQADAFLKLYPSNDQTQSGLSQKQSARDQGLVSMYLWATERAKTSQTKAYTYYFTRGIPWPEHPEFAAFHTGDLPYFFANLKHLDRPWEAVDRKLSDAASSYWVNFAKTGNPNGKGLPNWPAFEAGQQTTMELGEKINPRPVAEKEKLAFFTAYFEKQRTQRSLVP